MATNQRSIIGSWELGRNHRVVKAPTTYVIAILVLIVTGLLASCTEERVIVQHVDDDTVQIQAQVLAWWCGVGDLINNWGDRRFTPATGDSAKVTFIRDNGFMSWQFTDDSSQVEFLLSKGAHIIVVETPYSRPDTFFNFHLSQDTSINLDIVYDTALKEYIGCVFHYATVADTLGIQGELDVLSFLGQEVHSRLRTFQFEVQLEDRYVSSDGLLVIHKVEIDWAHENLFDVMDRCSLAIASDTTGILPKDLELFQWGIYICLHS